MSDPVLTGPLLESTRSSGPIFVAASVTPSPPMLHLSVAEKALAWHKTEELPAPNEPFHLEVHYESPVLEVILITLDGRRHREVFTVS